MELEEAVNVKPGQLLRFLPNGSIYQPVRTWYDDQHFVDEKLIINNEYAVTRVRLVTEDMAVRFLNSPKDQLLPHQKSKMTSIEFYFDHIEEPFLAEEFQHPFVVSRYSENESGKPAYGRKPHAELLNLIEMHEIQPTEYLAAMVGLLETKNLFNLPLVDYAHYIGIELYNTDALLAPNSANAIRGFAEGSSEGLAAKKDYLLRTRRLMRMGFHAGFRTYGALVDAFESMLLPSSIVWDMRDQGLFVKKEFSKAADGGYDIWSEDNYY